MHPVALWSLPLLADADAFWSYAYFILAFSLVIFVHELGHFAVAKMCGIKVERFSIGMPPRLVGIQIGETDYCIGALPLGGYVKMLGEEPGENIPAQGQAEAPAARDPRSFANKSVGARAAVLSAGVVMNVLFAFVLFIIIFNKGMEGMSTTVGKLSAEGPAARHRDAGAGNDSLRPGDVVKRVNGWGTEEFTEIMVAAALTDSDEPFEIEVERDGKPVTLHIPRGKDPSKARVDGRPVIGFEPAVALTLPETPTSGPLSPGDTVTAVRTADADKSTPVRLFTELTRHMALSAGREIVLTVKDRTGALREVTATPRAGGEGGAHRAGYLLEGLIPRIKVSQIIKDSPAAAVLRVGDVITAIDDVELPPSAVLTQRIASAADGVTLTVERPGAAGPVQVKVAARRQQWERRSLVGFHFNLRDYDNFIVGEVATLYLFNEEAAKALKRNGLPDAVADRLGPIRNRRFDSAETLRRQLAGLLDARQLAAHEDRIVRHTAVNRAARAGFAPGDRITSFDGRPTASWNDLAREIAATAAGVPVRRDADERLIGRPTPVTVQRGSPVREATLTVDVLPLEFELDHLPVDVGVSWEPLRRKIQAEGPVDAVGMGLRKTHYMMMQVYTTLRQMIIGRLGAENLSGPIGILTVGGQVAKRDTMQMWYLLAAISINLAVLNFLPIPVLDGGHILFLIIEKIRGRPVSPEVYDRVNRIGVLVLLALILLVTFNDVFRLFK
jgi:regulator of sigma E protease